MQRYPLAGEEGNINTLPVWSLLPSFYGILTWAGEKLEHFLSPTLLLTLQYDPRQAALPRLRSDRPSF